MRYNAAARAAVSAALHDLVGKRLGVPLYRLWGLDPRARPKSTFTIGLDTPEKIRAKVQEAAEYPMLKVKLGTDHDVEIMRTIRAAPTARSGWTPTAAGPSSRRSRCCRCSQENGVDRARAAAAARSTSTGSREITRARRIPVIADESCVTAADIPPLVGAVDGINIKLAKCGGLREALRMIAVARAHGMGHARLHDRELARDHRGRAFRAARGLRGPRWRGAALGRSLHRRHASTAAKSRSPRSRVGRQRK